MKAFIPLFLISALLCGCGAGHDAQDAQNARITTLEKQNIQLAMQIVNLQQEIYALQNANGVLDARTESTLKKVNDVNEKEAQTYVQLVDLQSRMPQAK